MRQCFREFSLEAYPELVVLVWPEYARPRLTRQRLVTILVSYCKQSAPLGYTGRWFLLQTGLYGTLFENAMYASRWILAPVYFGLSLALIALTIKFFQEILHVLPNIFPLPRRI